MTTKHKTYVVVAGRLMEVEPAEEQGETMSPELLHLHKIDKKLADALHFLQPDNLDYYTIIKNIKEAKKMIKEAIQEAAQYE